MDWTFLEKWATDKAIQFGLDDEWVDFVCWVVTKRLAKERRREGERG